MKLFVVILVTLLLLATGIWFVFFKNSPVPKEVQQAFTAQIENADAITLYGAVSVDGYAIQNWGDENKGGQALLKQDSATKEWKIISMGGGAWDVESLVAQGVPQAIAEQLVSLSN